MSNGNGLDARTQVLRRAIVGDMDARPGLAREGLLDILERLLTAKRSTWAAHNGKFTDVRLEDDYAVQGRALQTALALRGEFPSTKLDVNVHTPMERLPDLSDWPPEAIMQVAGFALAAAQDRVNTVDAEKVEAVEPPGA